jgi:hypothetical protein
MTPLSPTAHIRRRRRRIGRRKKEPLLATHSSGLTPEFPTDSAFSSVQTVATAVTAEVRHADRCVRRGFGPIRTRNGRRSCLCCERAPRTTTQRARRRWVHGKAWLGAGQARKRALLHSHLQYLTPGDYHRFHSLTAWVVEKRRHFQVIRSSGLQVYTNMYQRYYSDPCTDEPRVYDLEH